jgi:DNA polymerase III delta prime subunit
MTKKITSTDHATALEKELHWLEEVLDTRMALYFGGDSKWTHIADIEPPDLQCYTAGYGYFLHAEGFSPSERLVLILALAPYLKPWILDRFLIRNAGIERLYTEFGGVTGTTHIGFLPTAETACFLLGGADVASRLKAFDILNSEHTLFTKGILHLDYQGAAESELGGILRIYPDYLHLLTRNVVYHPPFSAVFPAKLLKTKLDWADLVLDASAREEMETLMLWLNHQKEMESISIFNQQMVTGYRALFYGPPGTGKSLTAGLIGKSTGRPVYRIDLSQVVSKYIGETEKNLSSLFDKAEHKGWILFFDEADALFGKRTEVSDSKDKFANQETAYLLQRIEDYNGLIILATNLKPNIDLAFIRRFQSIIYFRAPNSEQREKLWENALRRLSVPNEVDIPAISANYEISGGAINNIIQFAWLLSRKEKVRAITTEDIVKGIRREYLKEGKTFV